MNVDLTPELEELIEAKVSNGPYRSAAELIGDALRLLDDRDRHEAARWQKLRREIARGIEQLERGEEADLDVNEIKRKARELRARSQPLRATG